MDPKDFKKTSEHFKEDLSISSAQMKRELQYFITTNSFSLEMFSIQLP